MKVTIPIDKAWTPDLTPEDTLKAGGLQVCKNVMPVNRYYEPCKDKKTYNSTALTGTILNGIYTQDTDGQYYNFVGTSSKLYRFDKASVTNVTRATGGDYNSTFWNFAEYGNWLIATNYSDVPQILKGYTSTNFQALGGSPPRAKFCVMNNTHLVLGFLNDGTVYPKKLQWSARENPEDWTASLITGAGSQNLPDIIGSITGIGTFGENFIVASENSISIAYFTGTKTTFEFQINAVKNIGCFYPQSFISIGSAVFFWGKNSIYMFDGQIKDIGSFLRNTVLNNINIQYSHRITVTHNKEKKLIIWAYPTTSSTGSPDRLLFYNYEEDKWAYADMTVDSVFMGASGGIFWDDVNILWDDANILWDSNYWMNNNIVPMVGDTDGLIKTLDGNPLTAEIETGELVSEPSIMMVSRAYIPIYNLTGSGQITVKHRKSTIDTQTSSSASSIKSDGRVDLRTSNRRIALNLQATNFSKLGNTLEAEGVETAKR